MLATTCQRQVAGVKQDLARVQTRQFEDLAARWPLARLDWRRLFVVQHVREHAAFVVGVFPANARA